jgi:hypothetical protein
MRVLTRAPAAAEDVRCRTSSVQLAGAAHFDGFGARLAYALWYDALADALTGAGLTTDDRP